MFIYLKILLFEGEPNGWTTRCREDPEGDVPQDGRGAAEVARQVHTQGHQDLSRTQGSPQRLPQETEYCKD